MGIRLEYKRHSQEMKREFIHPCHHREREWRAEWDFGSPTRQQVHLSKDFLLTFDLEQVTFSKYHTFLLLTSLKWECVEYFVNFAGTYYCHVNNTVGEDTCHLEITGKSSHSLFIKYPQQSFYTPISQLTWSSWLIVLNCIGLPFVNSEDEGLKETISFHL